MCDVVEKVTLFDKVTKADLINASEREPVTDQFLINITVSEGVLPSNRIHKEITISLQTRN